MGSWQWEKKWRSAECRSAGCSRVSETSRADRLTKSLAKINSKHGKALKRLAE
jgi:hypothetical protein